MKESHAQGRRKHFFGGQAKNIMETNGVLARHEIFKFNYIHDYDVIIIGHERSNARARLLACYRCRRVLNETERKNGSDF